MQGVVKSVFVACAIALSHAPLCVAATEVIGAADDEITPFDVPLTEVGFAKIADSRGVSVYKDSNVQEIRIAAEGFFDASPDRVVRALLDYERQVGAIKRLSNSQVLERNDAHNKLWVYQRLNLPILSDRDYVLRVNWGTARKSDTHYILYHAGEREGPGSPRGVVRIVHHIGSWQFRKVTIDGKERTFARYQVSLDMAGSFPKWMLRSQAGKEIPDLYRAIAKLL